MYSRYTFKHGEKSCRSTRWSCGKTNVTQLKLGDSDVASFHCPNDDTCLSSSLAVSSRLPRYKRSRGFWNVSSRTRSMAECARGNVKHFGCRNLRRCVLNVSGEIAENGRGSEVNPDFFFVSRQSLGA